MSEQTIEGITKISVKGFKSIAEECEIDIRPLTLLAGANSSGKSSIMQPLLMLKQTLEAPYDPGPLLLEGPNVQFTETSQFLSTLSNENEKDHLQIQIGVQNDNYFLLVETDFRNGEVGIEIVKMTIKTKSETDQPKRLRRFTLTPKMSSEEIKSLADQGLIPTSLDVVKRLRCFLYVGSQQHDYVLFSNTGDLESNILGSVHIPGLRGNPERVYKLTSTGPRYSGTFEHYTASVIHEWQETKNKRLKTLDDALHTLGLTGQVSTKKIGDVGIEVQVGRLSRDGTDDTDMVNIADVGIRSVSSLARFSCRDCRRTGAVSLY